MKCLILISLMVCIATSASAQQDSEYAARPELLEVLKSYSDRTGVKFVLDPRVGGKAKITGIEMDEFDHAALVSLLLIHNLVAYENNDFVYIIVMANEEKIGELLGTKWKAK